MLKFVKFFFAFLFLVTAAFALFIATGSIPDSKAVTGAELPESAKAELVESGIISEDEIILYFYSEGLSSFVEFGNLFTDSRVISYETDPETDERYLYFAEYENISDIKYEKTESMLEDSIIEVHQDGELSFFLVVSGEEDRDDDFYNKLVQVWKKNLATSKNSI